MNRSIAPGQDEAPRENGHGQATDGTIEPLREAAREATVPRFIAAIRTQIFTVLALVALLGFGSLTILVTQGATASIDLAITRAIQSVSSPWVAALMEAVSWPGSLPQSVLIVAGVTAVIWLAGYRTEAVFALGAAASDILTETIKIAVGRPRPGNDVVHVIAGASGSSFPSGHTLFYVTFFGFLAYLAYARLKHGWLRTGALWLFGLLIVLVGPSRIWLGHHWASDVLASYTLGFVYLVLLIQIYSQYRLVHSPARPPAEASSGGH